MKNIRLMLMDKSEIIVPYSNVKDLVTTYSFVRDKCYEFKLFIKASEEEIEIIKKWLKNKANRKLIMEAAIRNSDVIVVEKILEFLQKIPGDELNSYIEMAKQKEEIETLLLNFKSGSK